MDNIKDVDLWSTSLRGECPAFVVGSFHGSAEVYSVAKKGALKLLGRSEACRFEGDKPSIPFGIPAGVPRVLIVYHGAGNAPTFGRLYAGE